MTIPGLKHIKGVPYISVGDAVAMARMTARSGYTAAQFADALVQLLPTPKLKRKKPHVHKSRKR
jgi:hypothetical protein